MKNEEKKEDKDKKKDKLTRLDEWQNDKICISLLLLSFALI